jgi:RNA recognition motif-containing protein
MIKLYVGNLPFDFTKEDLEELFLSCGNVTSAYIVLDSNLLKHGIYQPRGFGYVEMATLEEAENAIKKLNGYKITRGIKVQQVVRNKVNTRDGAKVVAMPK